MVWLFTILGILGGITSAGLRLKNAADYQTWSGKTIGIAMMLLVSWVCGGLATGIAGDYLFKLLSEPAREEQPRKQDFI
jgi:hypothetical protein